MYEWCVFFYSGCECEIGGSRGEGVFGLRRGVYVMSSSSYRFGVEVNSFWFCFIIVCWVFGFIE